MKRSISFWSMLTSIFRSRWHNTHSLYLPVVNRKEALQYNCPNNDDFQVMQNPSSLCRHANCGKFMAQQEWIEVATLSLLTSM
jgi:hypothetical protein